MKMKLDKELTRPIEKTKVFTFYALVSDGYRQKSIVLQAESEDAFRTHLNENYPYHIFLYIGLA